MHRTAVNENANCGQQQSRNLMYTQTHQHCTQKCHQYNTTIKHSLFSKDMFFCFSFCFILCSLHWLLPSPPPPLQPPLLYHNAKPKILHANAHPLISGHFLSSKYFFNTAAFFSIVEIHQHSQEIHYYLCLLIIIIKLQSSMSVS